MNEEYKWIQIPKFICELICKHKGHIKNYYWQYGDEICPRCGLWLNKVSYGWEEFK